MRTQLLIFLFLSSISFSQDIESLTTKASNGDLNSQFDLALKYYHGNNTKQDFSKAFYWFEKAALQGEPTSQFNLGNMYDEGEGVKEDNIKAKEWYLKAAEKGYCGAYTNLGILYEFGELGIKNKTTAIEWYKKGAKKKCVDCMYNLGEVYLFDNNTLVNRIENVLKWYESAATNGHSNAQLKLAKIYLIPEDHSLSNLNKDLSKAIFWAEKASQQNNSNALKLLGTIYQDGHLYDKNFKSNIETANIYYKKGTELGDIKCTLFYGNNIFWGKGTTKDTQKGINLIEEAAIKGDLQAQLKLAELHYFENFEGANLTTAHKWFDKVIESNTEGYHAIDLAEIYLEYEVEELIFKFYLIDAKEGNPTSQYNIGLMYKDGIGTSKNINEAKLWFKKALENGDEDAEIQLDKLK